MAVNEDAPRFGQRIGPAHRASRAAEEAVSDHATDSEAGQARHAGWEGVRETARRREAGERHLCARQMRRGSSSLG